MNMHGTHSMKDKKPSISQNNFQKLVTNT